MSSTQLPSRGLVFWPVGTGDSTTIVVDDEHVVQVDLHDMAMAADENAAVAAVVDRLVEVLPQGADGKPYLSAFILTHADKDHCLGFEDLLDRITIGEIWATPRLWREYTDAGLELCEDAKAFHEEVLRRVEATCLAVEDGEVPASGDRIRVIGYDSDEGKFSYHNLPAEYLSYPGCVVSLIDGEDLADSFQAFIHAPFKDDCAAARNDTSLALQVTLRDGADGQGHALLLLGDLAHDTIMKIFDYSESHDRDERVDWDILLAPHHCSKKVMYFTQNGTDTLQEDVLDALERHASERAIVVVSSTPFPSSNAPGDNPPHVKARNRYQERVEEVVCTGEYPTPESSQPVVFALEAEGLVQIPADVVSEEASRMTEASKSYWSPVRRGVLVSLGATRVRPRRARDVDPIIRQSGLDTVRQAVSAGAWRHRCPTATDWLRPAVSSGAAAADLTPGHRLALRQLGVLTADTAAIELVSTDPPTPGQDDLGVHLALDCSNVPNAPGGIRLRSRERFTVWIPPVFPFEHPTVRVEHGRWAGTPHVQWGRVLCLYASPSIEWVLSDGMRGLVERLALWLERASLGDLDPDELPLHPPVAYTTATAGVVVVRPDVGDLRAGPARGAGHAKG